MVYIKFPYWWLCRQRKAGEPGVFSQYVLGRHAISAARFDRDGTVVVQRPEADPQPKKVLDWIYALLTVLDAKASALMRLNGVMLAAAAFFLSPNVDATSFVRALVAGSGIGSTISIAACLLVVSVDWTFLGLVKVASASTDSKERWDFTDELFHLQQVAGARQWLYRFAWAVSFLTTIVFIVAAITVFMGVFQE